ncbi:alpha/beta fold hydrolase [Janthinobacterium fluminis]|uniref:Alpha/beta hydrolase n=1 Tax=Janthinobacterium fluminis TaxID=2987524 RepID=A0ABT5JWI2_9BURK|nr:alpha/beta hydrolase [Janthinobacterium fluminis]MDC8757100.1 alpha/beta hydrolase [Janthinobacterium fluminis]
MRRHATSVVQLHHLDTGEGEAVLLLHGLGSCAADWRPQIDALAPRYRVIAADLRGHGRSPAPGGAWDIADLADDVFDLMAQLRLRRVHLVGFSLGGMVALEMASRVPERVASLCLINSQPFSGPRPRALLFAYWLRRLVIATFGLSAMGKIIGRKLFPRADQRPLVERFARQMAGMSKRAYLAALDAIFHWRIAPRFDVLDMPVAIFAADQDYIPVEAKRLFAAQFQQCWFEVIADSRHASPLDQVALVNKLLLSFLTINSKNTVETP